MTVQNNLETVAENSANPETQNLPSAGELLSQERERRGLTEKEVADDLHITMHYVRAIESDSYEKLPGRVFARGYIKSYALLLGLDIELVMASYNAHIAKEMDVEKENTRIQVRKRKDRNRPWVIASAILFVGLFAGLWVINYSSSEPESAIVTGSEPSSVSAPSTQFSSPSSALVAVENKLTNQNASPIAATETETETETETNAVENVPMPVVSTASTNDSIVEVNSSDLLETEETIVDNEEDPASQSVSSVASAISEPVATPAEEGDQVIYVEAQGDDVLLISFSGESWVEVSDDSQGQIYQDLLETGDVLEVKGTAPFNVLLGDAPFAELTLNGNSIDVSDDIRIDNSARFTVGIKQ